MQPLAIQPAKLWMRNLSRKALDLWLSSPTKSFGCQRLVLSSVCCSAGPVNVGGD